MRGTSDTTGATRRGGGWLCVPPFTAIFYTTGTYVTPIILEDLSVKKKNIPVNCVHMILKFCSWISSSPKGEKGEEAHETSHGKLVLQRSAGFRPLTIKEKVASTPSGPGW